MEINSLIIIKNKLENYKLTHPNLYKIYEKYINTYELQILEKYKNLLICINNLENIKDLTNSELISLHYLLNL